MKITIEHTSDLLEGNKASAESREDGTFEELVQLFKQASLGAGFHPDAVEALEFKGSKI